MLLNYIKIFIYHLKQNKLFAFLNVLGLSIGIAGVIFAILYWNEEHSYDAWNPEKDNIFEVHNDLGLGNVWPNNPATIAPLLKMVSSDLESYCYYGQYRTEIIECNGKKELIDKVFSAQSDFFSFFPFEFIRGNGKSAIQDKNSMALSEETAKRLFHDENPIGKQVKYADKLFVVRGVYRLNKQASIMPAVVTTLMENGLEENKEQWGNFNFGLLLKLKDKSKTSAVIKQLNNLYFENRTKKWAKEKGMTVEAFVKENGEEVKTQLQPLATARLYANQTNLCEGKGNYQFLLILMGLSILILLLSIVNYINLATANAVKRAKEVGVRKIIGANKSQIVMQFIFETVALTLFSVLLALAIVELSLPYYNAFLLKDLVLVGTQFYMQVLLIFIIVVFVSGILPAVYVANFEALKVLKGNFSRSKNGVWLRNGMLVLQFAIATFFIIGSFVVYQQVNYMAGKDLGFKGAQILDVNFRKNGNNYRFDQYKRIKEEVLKIHGVENVSAGAFSIGSFDNSSSSFVYNSIAIQGQNMGVDFGMLKMMGIQIVQGRDLTPQLASDTISSVLVNETALKMMQEKNPLGKVVDWNDRKLKIVGVVKDFHMYGLQAEIPPMIFFHIKTIEWLSNNLEHISIKITPKEMGETIASLDKYWTTKVNTEYPFEYNFVDKNFARTFEKYRKQEKLFSLLNFIVITIAIFGLFALASFSMERRLREIAIRKTLGAETNVLLKELSKQYVVFCFIGFVIGIFPAYVLLQKWLENFAYRIDISIVPFIISFFGLLFLTLLIVLAKAYQVTRIDVLKYLKYE